MSLWTSLPDTLEARRPGSEPSASRRERVPCEEADPTGNPKVRRTLNTRSGWVSGSTRIEKYWIRTVSDIVSWSEVGPL